LREVGVIENRHVVLDVVRITSQLLSRLPLVRAGRPRRPDVGMRAILGRGIPEQAECSSDQEDRRRFQEHIPGDARLDLHHICRKVHDQVDEDYLDQGVLEFADPLPSHCSLQLQVNLIC
jgi:hypothetical protein